MTSQHDFYIIFNSEGTIIQMSDQAKTALGIFNQSSVHIHDIMFHHDMISFKRNLRFVTNYQVPTSFRMSLLTHIKTTKNAICKLTHCKDGICAYFYLFQNIHQKENPLTTSSQNFTPHNLVG